MTKEQGCELLPLNAIRTETVLSRFPIHNLAKTGNVDIQIRQSNEDGDLEVRWEVSYNARYGEPRQLAYKLDTLIINRRIEEVRRPLPKIIRLGTLKDICRELGLPESGTATNHIKKALRQNVGALITAKLKYKGADSRVRSLEADFHRYSVVFTGETLPDGRKADAVYLVLNEIYRDVLNTAQFRPLDYDYLKSLSPAAQRWYEVISYSMFAANKHRRLSADINYSDYCMYSGQERYFTWDKVKKQMYKLHQPHLKSGYITGFTHEAITDSSGSPDWTLRYIAGEKAKSEYRAFQRSKRDVGGNTLIVEAEATTVEPTSRLDEAPQHPPEPEEQPPALTDEETHFMTELVERFAIHEDTARELVTTKLDRVKFQLEVYPYRQHGRIKDAAAYIIGAIKRNYTAPADYQAVKAKKEEENFAEKAKALEAARKEHEEKFQSAYFEYLRVTEIAIRADSPDAYLTFDEHNADTVMKAMRFVKNPAGPAGRAILSEETRLTRFRDFFVSKNLVLPFWQWDEAHNPERFQGQHVH